MYIVRRTQLYLDDDLWSALHAQARRQGTTISDLVREAAREHYLDKPEDREEAMLALIGIRRDGRRSDSSAEVRSLRRGHRLTRLAKS